MKTSPPLTAWRPILLWLVLAGAVCLLPALPGAAQTPQYMTYQGYLTDQNGNALGTNGPQNYDIVFRIWNQPTGGSSPLYGELQTVTVANGYFSVLLGQGSPYVNGGVTDPQPPLSIVFTTNNAASVSRYVEMTVKGLASGQDVTILPRLQLVSAPYAFMAVNANALVNPTTGNTLVSGSGTNVIVSGAISASSLSASTFNGNLTDLGGSIYMDNGQQLFAKNSAGVYEACLWPRWSDNVTYFNYGSGGFNIRNNNSASTLWLGNNGNIGIGTINPGLNTMQINPLMETANGYGLVVSAPNATSSQYGQNIQINTTSGGIGLAVDNVANSPTANLLLLRNNTGSSITPVMDVLGNGFVGIGTTSPKAGLDVETVGQVNGGQWSYFEAGFSSLVTEILGQPVLNQTFGGVPNLTIYTTGNIGASTYYAFSDERIKNIIGTSSGTEDLNTLRKLRVTDFTYKDVVAKGSRPVKKLIAQQVESVFPQAVSKSTDVVPDIYRQATFKDGWVQLATNLKVGERVKLIGEKDQGVYKVLELREGAFRTEFQPGTEKVFVFGREVQDFRSVDYEAVAMLNVSATQELAKKVEKLEATQSNLAELEQKAARVDHLEQEVSELKQMVMKLSEAGTAARLALQPAAPTRGATDGRTVLTTASLDH